MAAGDDIQWWCRTDGDDTFSGGYDSGMPSAGTNYANQATAQLTLTDLATSGAGVKTITSVTGGFTAAMIGNCIRISAGTNFTAGYYWIDSYTNTNTISVTVSPTSGAAGSGGSGKIGGAFLGLKNVMGGGSGLATPSITSPLAAGHTINLGCNHGNDDPTSNDYDYSAGYWQPGSGSVAAGRIRIIGYQQGGGNGRPRIYTTNLLFHSSEYLYIKHLKFVSKPSAGFATYGIPSTVTSIAEDVYYDVNGNDSSALTCIGAFGIWIKNTGSTTAGTSSAVNVGEYGTAVISSVIQDVRGDAVSPGGYSAVVAFCVIDTPGRDGIRISANSGRPTSIINNTIYAPSGDGISFVNATDCAHGMVANNIIRNAVSDGIEMRTGTAVLNDKRRGVFRNNAVSGAGGNNYNAMTAPSGDLGTANPGFTNAAAGDFTIGTTFKAAAFPGVVAGAACIGYLDPGAVQRQEPAGGAGGSRQVNIRGGADQ